MAFPVDAQRVGTNGTTAALNKVCNLIGSGGGNPVSGNLLVLILRSAGADTHTTPAGWTLLVLNAVADGSDDVTSIWRRVANGTEGATVTVNGTASLKFVAICWAITGHDSATVPVISAITTGASATPDPTALAPAGGAKDYLWLWIGGWEGEQTSPPAGNPTNYSTPVGANSGVAGVIATNCRVAGATRQLNAASENPLSWTISVSDDWSAWTIAVYPSVSVTFFVSIPATVTGVATLVLARLVTLTLAATVTGVTTMARVATAVITRAATALGVATISRVATFSKTLAATSVGVATMTKVVTFFKTMAATAVGVVAMTRKQFVTMSAVATGVAGLSRTITAVRSLVSVATGIAALQAILQPFVGATSGFLWWWKDKTYIRRRWR